MLSNSLSTLYLTLLKVTLLKSVCHHFMIHVNMLQSYVGLGFLSLCFLCPNPDNYLQIFARCASAMIKTFANVWEYSLWLQCGVHTNFAESRHQWCPAWLHCYIPVYFRGGAWGGIPTALSLLWSQVCPHQPGKCHIENTGVPLLVATLNRGHHL